MSIGRQYVDSIEGGQEAESRLAQRAQQEIGDFPSIGRIYIVGAAGRIVLAGGVIPKGMIGGDVSDRLYFKRAANGDRGQIFDGPLRSKFTGEWLIVLSRRLENKKGDFLGVAVASIPVGYFQKRFAAVDLFPHGVMVFRTMQGLQVARYSLDTNELGVTGDGLISTELQAILRERPERDHEFYETLAPQDKVERLYAYQKLSHAPYFILIGQPKAVLDQSWRRLASELGLLSLGALVASLWIARRLHSSALSLNEDKRLLEKRVADRTKELEAKNRDLVASEAQAESANYAKSKFLAAASHDLRQPVQSLVLLLSVIERQVEGQPKAIETIAMMKQAVGGLQRLLTGILGISLLEAGVVEASMESVDVGDLVGRLAREYAPIAEAKGLRLRSVPQPLHARTDATLLERVLRNLIENALRFTLKGGILIGIRRRGERVRIDVIDTGLGIPTDKQTEIFEEFRQLHNPGRDHREGLGLGLAIVARLASLLGTQVEVASNFGRGSRFSLALPIATEAFKVAEIELAPEDPGGCVLIVEDNDILRHGLESMLQEWGYETLVATCGEDALELAAKQGWRFGAIVTDQRLGAGLTGVATAREIERRSGRVLPTLVLTGDTAKRRITEIDASGYQMLHKPVSIDELRRKLAQLMES
jgi:signal transduction histidine kinase/CheY-like chemotaxis protein